MMCRLNSRAFCGVAHPGGAHSVGVGISHSDNDPNECPSEESLQPVHLSINSIHSHLLSLHCSHCALHTNSPTGQPVPPLPFATLSCPDFHSEASIFPLGYHATRIHWSYRNPGARTVYVCEISCAEPLGAASAVASFSSSGPNRVESVGHHHSSGSNSSLGLASGAEDDHDIEPLSPSTRGSHSHGNGHHGSSSSNSHAHLSSMSSAAAHSGPLPESGQF